MKTGSQRCQPVLKCKCLPKYLAVLHEWCQTPCLLNVLWHFILWLAAQLQTQECAVKSERTALQVNVLLRGTNPPWLLIAVLLIMYFRKQGAQGRYFLFAGPFRLEQICKTQHRWQQNSGLNAKHQLMQVHFSISASLKSSCFFMYFVLETHFKCMINIWKLYWRKLRLWKI